MAEEELKFEIDPTTRIYTATRPVKTVSEFVKLVCSLGKHGPALFRGQKSFMDALVPKIGRPEYRFSRAKEKQSLDEFRRLSVPFLPRYSGALTELEWMAVAQHHGLATRLLDWTDSALTGLWFALERPCTIEERRMPVEQRHRVVWVFMPEGDDFVDEEDLASSPFSFPRTKVFKPRHVADRIRAQGGWFTVHKHTAMRRGDGSWFVPLNKNKNCQDNLRCIPIHDGWQPKFIEDLSRCGISDYTVFPDLGGLSSKLNRDMIHDKSHGILVRRRRSS